MLPDPSRVPEPGHGSILISYDKVLFPVAVEIAGNRYDHFYVYGDFSLPVPEYPALGETWIIHHLDILVPGQAVGELTADHVKVAVTVEVGHTGVRGPESAHRKRSPVPIRPVRVLDKVDESLDGAFLPLSIGVIGIVPTVFLPGIDTHDYVQVSVTIPVDIFPGMAALAFEVYLLPLVRYLYRIGEKLFAETAIFDTRGKHPDRPVRLGHTDIVLPL